MHLNKHDIPVRIDTDGAVARHAPGFGTDIAAEYFSLGAGTDLAPLLRGLDGDACQAAHWGYIVAGDVVVTYTDGTTENCITGDVFHWPAGHSIRVPLTAEIILFSEQAAHSAVIDHLRAQVVPA